LSERDVYTTDSVAILGYLAEALPSKVDAIRELTITVRRRDAQSS